MARADARRGPADEPAVAMSSRKRYGDPRKEQAYEEARREGAGGGAPAEGKRSGDGRARGRTRRELSVGYIFFAWIVFFLLCLAAGSLLLAALVFGVLLTGGIAVLNR